MSTTPCTPSYKAGLTARRFTLMEVLVALMLTAILVPVTLRALQIAGQLDNNASRLERAADLAELQLQTLIVTGDWESGDAKGDFGDDAPGFRWELVDEDWTVEAITMHRLDLTVYATTRTGETAVTVSTLVPEPGATDE